MDDTAWLRAEMDALRVSQKEVADLIGIDPSGVSRLVAGKRLPTTAEKVRLQRHFDQIRSRLESGDIADLSPMDHSLLVAGIGVEELAEKSGVPINEIMDSLRSDGRVSVEVAHRLAPHLGVRVGLLTGEERHEQHRYSRRTSRPRANDGPVAAPRGATVPVYGAPVLKDGRLTCEFEIVEMRVAPPDLQGAFRAYGLYIGEGDYGGRFRPGDIVWVQAGRPVRPGDDVLALLAPVIWVGQLEAAAREGHAIRNGSEVSQVTAHAELFRIVGASFG